MSEKNKTVELTEEELNNVSGGWNSGENIYTYCPICNTKSQKHVIISWYDDLECLKCHGHHRHISCNQAGDPDSYDLQCYYNETK